MRKLYSALLYLLTPLVLLYLFLRGLRDRDYLRRWPERFAHIDTAPAGGGIVVHAASVGEVNAAAGLVHELLRSYPERPFCLTTITPTGSERARALFGDTVNHLYAPLDLPGAVRRFFDRVRPGLVIVMETEIWPNLFHEAGSRGIPLMVANARISRNSFGRYLRFRTFIGAALSRAACIGAQSEQDAERLLSIGSDPERLIVTGNLKFDVRLPVSLTEQGEAIRLSWGANRLVLLAGSTHEGDEGPLLEAFKGVLSAFPDALLILVPRHPERFGRAAQGAHSAGLSVTRRSESVTCGPDTQCYLIDAMGELLRYYAACDVAFVGGSIEPVGGQNVLEPAGLGKPVIVGPHTFNFEEITQRLIESGAALRIRNSTELEDAVLRLFRDANLRDRMGRSGAELVRSGQGALAHTLRLVEELITPTTG